MKKVRVDLSVRGYDILIGGYLLSEIGEHIRATLFPKNKRKK